MLHLDILECMCHGSTLITQFGLRYVWSSGLFHSQLQTTLNTETKDNMNSSVWSVWCRRGFSDCSQFIWQAVEWRARQRARASQRLNWPLAIRGFGQQGYNMPQPSISIRFWIECPWICADQSFDLVCSDSAKCDASQNKFNSLVVFTHSGVEM